jgi:hypothetical protein
MIKHDVIDVSVDSKTDAVGIRVMEGAYEGCVLLYGKVWFEEKGEEAILHFNVDLVENPQNVTIVQEAFTKFAGDLLLSKLDEEMKNNSVIYHGGT